MGLSKRNRVRVSDAEAEVDALILRYAQAIQPALTQAIQMRVWLEGMQTHLKYTSLALRDRPAAALAHFQKTLGRPSYFLTSTATGHWVVLLGPRAGAAVVRETPAPLGVPAVTRLRAPLPSLRKRLALRTARFAQFVFAPIRFVHQWLMHPLIDTREPS